MLRISGKVQPVSSYGDGFDTAKFWSEKYMSAIVRYGWSPRTIQSPACTCTCPALKGAVATLNSNPCVRRSLTASAAFAAACCPAGITQPLIGPVLPRSTARLFLSQ